MAGVDPVIGLNNFNQAKYLNESETIANSILNLLFGKPGFFPSMPNLGINIQSYLYSFWDEVDVNFIKAQIAAQCGALKEYIDDGSLDVIKSSYLKKPLLLIVLPVIVKHTKEHISIGITQNEDGNIIYNYVFEEVVLD